MYIFTNRRSTYRTHACKDVRPRSIRLPMTSLVLLAFCWRGWTWTKTLSLRPQRRCQSKEGDRKTSPQANSLNALIQIFRNVPKDAKHDPCANSRGVECEQTHSSRSPFLPSCLSTSTSLCERRAPDTYRVCNLLGRSGEPVAELKQMRSDVYFRSTRSPVFVPQYVQAPLHLAGIGRGFKPYALTLGAAAAEKLHHRCWQLARSARCALALCSKSGGGGLAFRPDKMLSCANF